jgi:release factor glutamine methyltransferase
VKSTETVREALLSATAKLHSLATARRDAELLLMRVVGRDRAWMMTHADAELTAEQISRFEKWVARRARQEPVQYILGETEFYGLTLRVTAAVLIPRPETEHLVEAVLSRMGRDIAVRICDVGTGSGAIAVALAHALPWAQVTAVDLSAAALDVARENAERHGVAGRVRLVESDLLRAVRGERFDVVVSNPPYVAKGDVLEAQVREYEPREALFAGPTGLEIYRRLIPEAREALVAGGWLLIEIGHGQRAALADLLAGWDGLEFVVDLQGIPRVAIAQRRA